MKLTKTYELLAVLNVAQLKKIKLFLCSPYINTKDDLILIFKYLSSYIINQKNVPKKERFYKLLFKNEIYNATNFNRQLSLLNKLIEKFILIEYIQNNEQESNNILIESISQKEIQFPVNKNIVSLNEFDNSQSYHLLYQYYTLQYKLHKQHIDILQACKNLDTYFIAEKLKLACFYISLKDVLGNNTDTGLFNSFLETDSFQNIQSLPIVDLYFSMYKVLLQQDDEISFNNLIDKIKNAKKFLSEQEIRDLLLFSGNVCINMANKGIAGYYDKLFEIYKLGLKWQTLQEGGLMSRFTYKNIVTLGIKLKEYDFTAKFIEKNIEYIEETYKQSTYAYNKAVLEYELKHYDKAINLLQQTAQDDTLLYLASKNLQMKIYFELNYEDALSYLIASIKTYLNRKKLDATYKSNYQNIIKFINKLSKLKQSAFILSNRKVQVSKDALIKDIQVSKPCTEKQWLLLQVDKIE